jgi:SagB-type dehydrogenase family enzyme
MFTRPCKDHSPVSLQLRALTLHNTIMSKELLAAHREFLKDTIRLRIDFRLTDQSRGIAPPPVQKPPGPDQDVISLPGKDAWPSVSKIDLVRAIATRSSKRVFRRTPLKLDELAFLLWATQGIRTSLDQGHALRVVPSAGCRHAFETYLAVFNVESLERGIYRYLPVQHGLVLERRVEDLGRRLTEASLGQKFTAASAVTFIWSVLPYRMEWRYGLAAHRVIPMDAGHLCQNLYLAVQAVGCGACAVAAYHQQEMDELLGLDGEDEFAFYMAPVGKV